MTVATFLATLLLFFFDSNPSSSLVLSTDSTLKNQTRIGGLYFVPTLVRGTFDVTASVSSSSRLECISNCQVARGNCSVVEFGGGGVCNFLARDSDQLGALSSGGKLVFVDRRRPSEYVVYPDRPFYNFWPRRSRDWLHLVRILFLNVVRYYQCHYAPLNF